MKRIGIEISAVCYNFVTIRYDVLGRQFHFSLLCSASARAGDAFNDAWKVRLNVEECCMMVRIKELI